MGRAYLNVSPELLASALNMPDNTNIYGVEWSFEFNAIKVFVESPELPKVAKGAALMQIGLIVRWNLDGDGEREEGIRPPTT